MIEVFVFLLTVILLASIGVAIYFYNDYVKHKDENESDIHVVKTDITKEKNDRLGNLAFVVEQVNNTNRSMMEAYDEKYTKFESGFGSIISVNDANGANIPIKNLGNTPTPIVDNIKMMKKVSVVGGMTINEIRKNAGTYVNTLKACNVGSTKCNEFPNSEGDVFLTGFGDTNTIVLDSPALLKKGTTITGKVDIKKTNGLATDPVSSLEVDANGDLLISPSEAKNTVIKGKVNIKNGVNVGSLEVDANGNLSITPPTNKDVVVNGINVKKDANNVALINGIPINSVNNSGTKTVTIGDIQIVTKDKTVMIDGIDVTPPPPPTPIVFPPTTTDPSVA